jgi:luciferase family oxidoreductase group 1
MGRAVPLSILDLAIIGKGETARDALEGTVVLARLAEEAGYRRVWYAEHHNMGSIASSAPAVLIAHVAAHTQHIRLGAGGVMLPNHSPLTIAEQFGTLETLHPGRIELGVGRAPGSDQNTQLALRRGPAAADRFPHDVVELIGYLRGESRVPGVTATPGAGTNVPIYVLGSSLFGAELAARLGLPYGFASHFAPGALEDAVALYRKEFQPSDQLDAPHVIAGVNVVVADNEDVAREHLMTVLRSRVNAVLGGGRSFSDEEADYLLRTPQGRHIAQMMTYSAVGTPAAVRRYLDDFAEFADADELIVVLASPTIEARLQAAEQLADGLALATDPGAGRSRRGG